jgi:hypothetical protein
MQLVIIPSISRKYVNYLLQKGYVGVKEGLRKVFVWRAVPCLNKYKELAG